MTPFQEMFGVKYTFLQWNQENFNFLKEPLFLNQEKISKPFKILLFLRKQEKCSNSRLFTIFMNIHKFIKQWKFVWCKKNLSFSNGSSISVNALIYTEIGLTWSWEIWGFEYIPLFVCFHEISTKKYPHITILWDWL